MAARARKPTNNDVVSVEQMLNGTADSPALQREEDDDDLDPLNDPGVIGHEDDARGDNLAAIMSVLEQIPDEDTDARVMVYRVRPEGGDAFLFEKTARDFASKEGGAAYILRHYGGGTYRIRVYRKVQQTSSLTGMPFMRQAIAGVRKVYLEEPRVQEVEVKTDTNSLALAQLTETMMRSQQETREMIGTLAKSLTDAVSAIANRPEPPREPQKTTADILNEMLLMKKVMGLDETKKEAPVSVAQQMKEILGLTREVREMVADDSPPTDEVSGLMKMGSQVLELIKANQQGQPIVVTPEMQKQMLAQQQQPAAPIRRAQQPAPPSVKQLPAGSVVLSNPPVPSAPEQITQIPGGEDVLSMLSVAVHQLVGAAERNSDPYAYAVTLLDQVGDETIEKFLGAPDWYESLVAINPHVKEHGEWFRDLHAELTVLIKEGRETEEQELQEGGNGDTTGIVPAPGPTQPGVSVHPKPDDD